ncbi:MAG TPA: hypothetical protein PLA94_07385, partial [Myxococcota bacterium]|nr:hypothetical protein [Myxococcota bacterium]
GSGAKKRERGETRHLAEAELQQAMLVVESLLQEGTGLVGGSKGLVISAVTSLSEADQLKLFEADELSGRRLYSLLYMTAKGNPELKPLFKKVKAASQRARIARRLDTHDRSGESSKAMEELQLHLTQSGLSEEDRQAFTDKLDFKMVLAGGQKKDPDLRLPDTSQEGWRGKFLCQSLGILAETPEISDESLRKALDLPPTDLLNMIAYAAIGDEVTHSGAQQSGRVKDGKTHHSPLVARREGESRILRVLGELAAGHLAQGETEGWTELDQLLKGVDNGAYDAKLLQAELKKGTSFPDILKALQKDLSDRAEELEAKAKTKYKDLKEAQTQKLQSLEEELKDTDRKDAREKFLELDKLRAQVKYLSKTPPTQKELEQMLATFGRAPLLPLDGNDSDFLKVAVEVGIHLEAVRDPLLLKVGMENSGFVLPTAGKSLKDFPWIVTTAMDMVETAKKIRAVQPTFSLARYPIVILDQTDGDGTDTNRMKLWNQNAAYIKKLNEDYAEFGLRVEHVGMGAINKLIRGSGVEKLFDTTGENNAGYGGARNIGFLLGPLVQDVIRSGEKLEDLEPEDLVERLQKCALGEDAPKLFMGDDTDSLRPGTITAKMGIAASEEYGDDYTAILTPRGGRDTQSINSGVTNNVKLLEQKGYEGFIQEIFCTNAWNINNTTPGMGCAFGEPRFCLDLPSGAEEKHCEPGKKLIDSFSQANHLSGDRKAPPAAYLRGQLAYCNTTEMVKGLFPPLWNWNTAAFKTLGTEDTAQSLSDMFEYAGTPEEVDKQQESLLFNLAKFSMDRSKGPLELDGSQAQAVQDYLDKHPELDEETRDELVEIKKVYVDAARQSDLIKTYIQRLFGKMVPDLDLGPALKDAFTDEDLNAFRNCISNQIKDLDRPAILGRAKDAILDALETAVTGKGQAGVQEALVSPATVLGQLRKPVGDALLGAMTNEIQAALLDPNLLLDGVALTEAALKSKLVVSTNLDYPAGLFLKRVLSELILTDRDVFLDAVRELRTEMKLEGIEFNGKNRLLRDLVLALESMSGGFAEIANTLTA